MAVYFPDSDFNPTAPNDDEVLWRYIDFTQFISIIETKNLWFSAADVFIDKWEGGLTTEQVKRISKNIPSFIDDNGNSVRQLYDALRATTYVSCWHLREEETASMWELYNDRGKEVAIKTTVENLRKAIHWQKDMSMGCVEYKKYNRKEEIFPVTRTSPFFHKRISFRPEQEFRVVKSEFNLPERVSMDENLKEHVASKSGSGRKIAVDRATLIDEVVVSPVAGNWMRDLVEKVLLTHGMEEVSVVDSKLRRDPFST